MSEYHFPVPGHEDDKIVVFTRSHWASLFGNIFLTFMMLLVPIILLITAKNVIPHLFSGIYLNFIAIFGAIYYLVTITFAFTEWITYYYNVLIVTDDEIIDIKQHGIFDRTINELSLLRVQDVSASIKGFIPTFFSYGDVVAESAGENTRTYIINNVPNPVEIANKILSLHEQHVAREERTGEITTAEGDLRAHKIETPASIVSEFRQAIEKEIHHDSPEKHIIEPVTTQSPTNFVSPPSAPLPTQLPTEPENQAVEPPTETSSEQGEIKKDDLDQGGEVKF